MRPFGAAVRALARRLRSIDARSAARVIAGSWPAKSVEFFAWSICAIWSFCLLAVPDLHGRTHILGTVLGGPVWQTFLGLLGIAAVAVEGVGLYRRAYALPHNRKVRKAGCVLLWCTYGFLAAGYLEADYGRPEGWTLAWVALFCLLAYARLELLPDEGIEGA
jgi:hypothetical protein